MAVQKREKFPICLVLKMSRLVELELNLRIF